MRCLLLLLLILLFAVTEAAVSTASQNAEECRSEWCNKDSIHVTTFNGKKVCCDNKKHMYMFQVTRFREGKRLSRKCLCRIAD
ncbi:hypothetical protein RRG08_012230 [Elysia crispata]|uniref:Plethodontid modulating factor n=1 Tax=Elysia crispata TaxID=231223 RepID=A0AAE1CLH1_9GAST|nr:hypothetical protein RRG08_012230 [Elysia crispata]